MTAPYRKKLIEVALPLAKINEAAAREKSIRHGHPSTLHLWWARRPLAACRAVLFASLVDDPDSDPEFSFDENVAASKRAKLFDLIEKLVLWENSNNPRVINAARAEIARCVASRKLETGELKKDQVLRSRIRKNSGEAQAPNSCEFGYETIESTYTPFDIKGMLAKPEDVNAFLAEHAPPVLDPFCGGGSIPLEAQRLGLRAYASDLNPVPVLITKALIEIPPKFAGRPPVNPEWQAKSKEERAATVWHGAQGLAADVRYYGQWMRHEAEKRFGHLYPKVKVTKEMAKDRPDLKEYVGEELTVIAWISARTVASPNPVAQGAHVPLVSTLMVSTKEGKKTWAEICHDPSAPNGWRFHVRSGELSEEKETKAKLGTKAGKAKDFICCLSETPVPRTYIQAEGKADRLAVRLMAIVCEGQRGRVYLSPDERSEAIALSADKMPIVEESRHSFLSGTLPTRAMITGGVCSAYGLRTWGHLFTPRQLVALTMFSDLVQEARECILTHCRSWKSHSASPDLPLADGGVGATAYSDAVATYLAFTLSRQTNRLCTLCFWDQTSQKIQMAFGRQALAMTWDFCEANPFSDSSGNWLGQLQFPAKCVDAAYTTIDGTVRQLDAVAAMIEVPLAIISTDPPYYDNISYAELSDFFYVWLRRSLVRTYPSLCATLLTPKKQELIANAYRHDGSKEKAQAFFENGLGHAFELMRQRHHEAIPLTVFYAFKQSETQEGDELDDRGSAAPVSTGWETMLEGILRGFSITGTWPMRTELIGNLKKNIGALASSIVLVCRPRPANAPLTTRKQFITALRQELPDALRNLQRGNIAPVDLAQAAIGPGMAVFTRYAKVMETDGSAMSVRTALGLINQSLDEVLAEQEGEFDGETRWALAWFEQFGMDEGPFGVAETLSKAKNTAINGLVESGIVTARAGKVRLVKRAELPVEWDPAAHAARLAIWLVTQHLIHTLDQQGESGAAALLRQLGGVAENARDLAYRLYRLCERKKWAEEALAYNGLVIAWPELTKLALAERSDDYISRQNELDFRE